MEALLGSSGSRSARKLLTLSLQRSQFFRSAQQGAPWVQQPPKPICPNLLADVLAKRIGGKDRDETIASVVKALPRHDRIYLAHALTQQETFAPTLEDPMAFRGALGSLDTSYEETGTALHVPAPADEAEDESEVVPPSRRALTLLAISHGIPFVGFGFLDNFIMITAGESIEASLGAALSLSSMCAAGFGNLISDIAGLSLQDAIAKHTHRIAKEPELTPAQEALDVTQRARAAGAVVGISVGCIIGMCPLLVI